ncbi:hypothetical protein BpHYR1_038733 [Brachionus plicatilis]|uniref:Uncharacterized protein n=1 Tax=Brachionus plicatilis TaxID=10195 RepID=A0A3M7S9Y5_BRAPC|nr:hypothetical protein BpHYR1_038733 [Brachionus plicatilis]
MTKQFEVSKTKIGIVSGLIKQNSFSKFSIIIQNTFFIKITCARSHVSRFARCPNPSSDVTPLLSSIMNLKI